MLKTSLLLLVLLPLLALCSFVPGFFILRRIRRLTVSERISGSIALSLTILYLLATAIYLLGIDWRWCWLITAGCAAMAIVARQDLARLWARRRAREQFIAFSLLFATAVLFLMVIQHYSGGSWGNDWIEHHQRTTFFLQRQPPETIFLDLYILPARPPMTHLVSAFFLAQTAGGFELFQVVFAFLNAAAFFPCVLLAGLIVPMGGRKVWLIAAFLATTPMFMHNTVYSWNKLSTAYFVVLSIALYLRGWQRQSPMRIIAAAGTMAVGIVVHYSAAPYAAFMGLHYLCTFPWRRHKLIESLGSLATVALILISWLGWCLAVYGFDQTFKSNTTVADSQSLSAGENIAKIGKNIYYSIVPLAFRPSEFPRLTRFEQPNPFGYVRDHFFVFTQQSLPGTFGLVGWVIVPWLAYRFWRRGRWPLRVFWASFVLFSILVGIAVHGSLDDYGVAHICLQPLTIMGMTLLAAGVMTIRSPLIRGALVMSVVIGAILGIVLQVRLEMLALKAIRIANADVILPGPALLNFQAVRNSCFRFVKPLNYLADFYGSIAWLLVICGVILLGAMLVYLAHATMSGRPTPRKRRLHPLAGVTAAIYGIGAIICLADHSLGYQFVNKPPIKMPPDNAEYNERINLALQAINRAPESADAHYFLATEYYSFGQVFPTCRSVSDALLLDPWHKKSHYLLGVMLISAQVKFPPDVNGGVYNRTYFDNPLEYHAYGIFTYADRGFRKRGLEIIQEAHARFPDDPEIRLTLGVFSFNEGERERGIEHAAAALARLPGSPEAAGHLREMMRLSGWTSDVIERKIVDARNGAFSLKP